MDILLFYFEVIKRHRGDKQMEHLDIQETPKLRDPALLMAFAGWNDASSAATTAASFITEKMKGSEFQGWNIFDRLHFQLSIELCSVLSNVQSIEIL